jgi:RNA polymerase sigma factor (sigma-70 family)
VTSDGSLAGLRSLFIDRYQHFKGRLARLLGSDDIASEALHDTWLRLAQAESVGAIQNAESYLFRAALNAADDRRQREKHHRAALNIESLPEMPDERPTPEDVVLARSELEAFKRILADLPARRRTIFLAARLHNMPQQEIADRLGVSLRLVSKELLLAHRVFVAQLKEIQG